MQFRQAPLALAIVLLSGMAVVWELRANTLPGARHFDGVGTIHGRFSGKRHSQLVAVEDSSAFVLDAPTPTSTPPSAVAPAFTWVNRMQE